MRAGLLRYLIDDNFKKHILQFPQENWWISVKGHPSEQTCTIPIARQRLSGHNFEFGRISFACYFAPHRWPNGFPRKAAVLFANAAKTVDPNGPAVRIINMITLKCDFFMSYYTCILRSRTSTSYYFEHCKDLQKRIANHNAGKVRSTKHNCPWHPLF